MKKAFLLFSLFLITGIIYSQPLTVINGFGVTPNDLGNCIMGQGLTIFNITYSGNMYSNGIFSGGNLVNSDSGIFISTGIMTSTIADSANVLLSDDLSLPGDSTLDSIISPTPTYDASVLEFDFAVASDSFQMNFVFASEEYNEFVNATYNDAFGIFLSGPGINGIQNIALMPGTTTPVSVNTLNNGQSWSGAGTGPCMNCQYYNDNFGLDSFAFDGYTTPIRAIAKVNPCDTYHLKIAIADAGDHIYNSTLFIEYHSLSYVSQIPIFANGNSINNGDTISSCIGDTIVLSLSNATNYNWSTGATTQSIYVPSSLIPQTYSGYVFNPSNFCFAFSNQVTIVGDSCLPKPSISFYNDTLFSSVTDLQFAFQWRLNGAAIPNATDPFYKVNTGGCYSLMLSDSSGHSITSDTLCLSFTGISNTSFTTELFQPNPFKESAQIEFENFSGERFELILSDVTGRIILQKETSSNTFTINQNELGSGYYFYSLINFKGKIKSKGTLIRL